MSDVTRILSEIGEGDALASEKLLPLVYDELRRLAAAKLAHEKPGQTLQATALVHEAYMRLVDVGTSPSWSSRGHFYAAAGEAMRRIMVDKARRKNSIKRGGALRRVDFDPDELSSSESDDKLLALDEALAKLEKHDAEKAKLVKLRWFSGLSINDAAEAMGVSTATADRHWAYARAWLQREMSQDTQN